MSLAEIKSEINDFAIAVKTYQQNIVNFIKGVSNVYPSTSAIAASKNDALHTLAVETVYNGQSSSYGAITQSVFQVESLKRELRMVSSIKADYYSAFEASTSKDNANIIGDATHKINYIMGKAPSQQGMSR